ncbi:phosphatidylserine decarboxylase proenzyme, mitochondrial-like isoform X2 [Lycorma delicatula]|uniref:phosphatidylserine decarboxylase proenzyme, mitochondrial-like isoform X2 n=1 Tax=Lycorma delicatula TaxID=130591 RepID=UPI003F51307B
MFYVPVGTVKEVFVFSSNRVFVVNRSVSTGGAGAAKVGIQSKWKKLWTRWIPIPTGIGLTLLAILQWGNVRNKQLQEQQIEKASVRNWEITCYRSVPLRPLSRAWGWISDRPVPLSLRHWIYGNYAKIYAVNLDEVENDLISYASLAEFFSRRLKDGVRPIDTSQCVVSPADGTILNLGEVTSCHIEQVKGVTYSIQTFLGDMTWKQLQLIKLNHLPLKSGVKDNNNNFYLNDSIHNANRNHKNNNISNSYLNNTDINLPEKRVNKVSWKHCKKLLLKNPTENELYQIVIYLAPGDYHRFHSPVHWDVHYRRHFQGELLSVSPKVASWIPELFSLNERVIYFGEWEHGFFSMTAVGATNVGSIRVHSDESLHTNGRRWAQGIKYKDKNFDMTWEKGEEVGEFRMGSTIVILFEAPKGYKFNAVPSQRVKVGQSVTCPFKCNEE